MPSLNNVHEQIVETFGNKLRVRVCGILIKNDSIVLVKHHNLGGTGTLWAPPGGGMNFGESVHETLVREFKEETNLDIEVGELLLVTEYLDKPLHAVELFFGVSYAGGELKTGYDPEMKKTQIISVVEFVPFNVLKDMNNDILHKVLHDIHDEYSFERLSGKYLHHIKS